MKVASKVKDIWNEHKFRKLEKDVEKYSSFQNKHTLNVNEEEEWYCMTLERVKEMKDKSTVEILQELLTNVPYHPEIKKRMKKQIKKLLKEPGNKTIENCLSEIMQGYVFRKEDADQTGKAITPGEHQSNSEAVEVGNELIKQPKNDTVQSINENSFATKQQVLTTSEETKELNYETRQGITIPESLTKTKKQIRKRCYFCRKRGHLKKNCPIKQKCWN